MSVVFFSVVVNSGESVLTEYGLTLRLTLWHSGDWEKWLEDANRQWESWISEHIACFVVLLHGYPIKRCYLVICISRVHGKSKESVCWINYYYSASQSELKWLCENFCHIFFF